MIFYSMAIILGAYTSWVMLSEIALGDFRGISIVFLALILFFSYLTIFYRSFMRLYPLPIGQIPIDSQAEFIHHIHVLFFILGFNPLLRSGLIPFPLLRLIYLALGAKIGDNSYSSGIIYDPLFVKIGKNCILGQSSLLTPHQTEGALSSYEFIEIGDNVTIGAHAIIFQGVKIGDKAIVAAGSVVRKGTFIGENKVWGGVPAKFIKTKDIS